MVIYIINILGMLNTMKTTIQIHEIELELFTIKSLLEFLNIYLEGAEENLGISCIIKEININLESIFKSLED